MYVDTVFGFYSFYFSVAVRVSVLNDSYVRYTCKLLMRSSTKTEYVYLSGWIANGHIR